jgi:hypothetical protein
MRIHADPDPGQTLKSQKVEFLQEKYTLISMLLDPDPHYKYESGSPSRRAKSMRIRIRKLPAMSPHILT